MCNQHLWFLQSGGPHNETFTEKSLGIGVSFSVFVWAWIICGISAEIGQVTVVQIFTLCDFPKPYDLNKKYLLFGNTILIVNRHCQCKYFPTKILKFYSLNFRKCEFLSPIWKNMEKCTSKLSEDICIYSQNFKIYHEILQYIYELFTVSDFWF